MQIKRSKSFIAPHLLPTEAYRLKISRELSYIWKDGVYLLCRVNRKGKIIHVVRNAHPNELKNYKTITTVIRLEKSIKHYTLPWWEIVCDAGRILTLQRGERIVKINMNRNLRSENYAHQISITDVAGLTLPLFDTIDYGTIRMFRQATLENWLERHKHYVMADSAPHSRYLPKRRLKMSGKPNTLLKNQRKAA